MKTINRIITRLSGATELFIFFFFLTTSLFLGDGKQPFVDVWWALGILMMYGVRYYQRGKLDLRPLPRMIGLTWTALILYYIILTPFSDSAGYSITATIRLIEAYLVYVMFVTVSSEKTTDLFTRGILFVGVIATLVSFVFLFFPSLAGFLPPMNLLYATYGHNHLADLLLFVFPVAIGLVEKKQSQAPAGAWRNIGVIGLLVLFVIGMLLTFARGAWILLVLYLMFLYLKNKSQHLKKIVLVGVAVLVVIFLAVSLLSRNGVSAVLAQNVPRLARLIQKPSLLEDGRWEYWRQAIEAIKERPLFGSGPGTFYLESKRLQSAPSSHSWFAHSFPLQTLVELGLVGAIPLFILLFLITRLVRDGARTQQHGVDRPGLITGLSLTLAYSFYEFNLDYVAVWLLFWACLGVLTGVYCRFKSTQTTLPLRTVKYLVIFIGVYYAWFIVSALSVVYMKKAEAPPFFSVLDSQQMRTYIAERTKTGNQIFPTQSALMAFFHRRDPDVSIEMARYFIKVGQLQDAQRWYNTAVRLDPKNGSYVTEYISFLFDYEPSSVSVGELFSVSKRFLPLRFYEYLDEANKYITPDIQSTTVTTFYRATPFKEPLSGEYLARIYYFLGLDAVNASPELTKSLWIISRDLDPSFSFYHAELASLYFSRFNNIGAAQMVLRNCLSFVSARQHCRDLLGENPPRSIDLPLPGFYTQTVRDFPL